MGHWRYDTPVIRGRVLIFLSVLFTISSAFAAQDVNPPGRGDWDRAWWIERTARILRAGQGLSPEEDLDRLLALSPEQVIDHFYSDPRFGDTALDFSLYFLGNKQDQIREPSNARNGYNFNVYNTPQAISAAKAMVEDGDFFEIFSFNSPYYLKPIQIYRSYGWAKELPAELAVELQFAFNQRKIEDLVKEIRSKPSTDPKTYCEKIISVATISDFAVPTLLSEFTSKSSETSLNLLHFRCLLNMSFEGIDLASELEKAHAQYEKIFRKTIPFRSRNYEVRYVRDFRAVDLSDAGGDSYPNAFIAGHFGTLINSVTNYNRKRAAHILKRFFCDDLTPINVAAPDDHAKDKHGTDVSCRACHYKLDPMAGFFRNYGGQFINFAKSKSIIFDDLSRLDRETYASNWKAPEGSSRVWNVGYIRSTENDSLNSYGSELSDLTRIMRESPETKRCIVKRLAEYVVGEDQVMDAGYLDHLTKLFMEEAKISSGRAMKSTLKRLLLSQVFKQRDPVADRCYDYAPGAQPENSPPCKVAFLLQKNCATCHGSSSRASGLDLTRWVEMANGKFAFPHERAGQPVPRETTFERILERLSSTDPARRMPLRSYISSADREAIYLWVREMLDQAQKEGR